MAGGGQEATMAPTTLVPLTLVPTPYPTPPWVPLLLLASTWLHGVHWV